MRGSRVGKVFIVAVLFNTITVLGVSADIPPGTVINGTNYEMVRGLLPEPVLDWIKKGDFVLRIGKHSLSAGDFFPSFALESYRNNAGKYALDERGGIVESSTGKPPGLIIGVPFPDVDPGIPRAPEKIMYNNLYMQYTAGNLRFPFEIIFINRSTMEREIECEWQQAAMVGHPGARELRNPDRVEKYAIMVVKKPYDLAGTAVMLWRYMDPHREDMTFGYVPMIRRVRRMSPANRSDAFVGSDTCSDDANGYDGKIPAFSWKLVGKQEALRPFLVEQPARIVKNELGEWMTTENISPVVYGFQKREKRGVAWAPTNLVWVKCNVYVIEGRSKDPYYNYGLQYIWIDARTFSCIYKVVHDRTGRYWKMLYKVDLLCESGDKKMRLTSLACQQMIDDRSDHSTVIEDASPRNIMAHFAKIDMFNFTLGGFQKFCK